MIAIQDTPAGARFAVRVQPRARKNAITGELGDALKVALTATPVEGRANDACIEFFAAILNVPRSSITIAAGQTSRNKRPLTAPFMQSIPPTRKSQGRSLD